jgi:hypothetical protein
MGEGEMKAVAGDIALDIQGRGRTDESAGAWKPAEICGGLGGRIKRGGGSKRRLGEGSKRRLGEAGAKEGAVDGSEDGSEDGSAVPAMVPEWSKAEGALSWAQKWELDYPVSLMMPHAYDPRCWLQVSANSCAAG